MPLRFGLVIYWSPEDQAFLVEVPELPGCKANGQSYEEAVANARVVIEEWIQTAQELGGPIPEPQGKLILGTTAGIAGATLALPGSPGATLALLHLKAGIPATIFPISTPARPFST